MVATRSAEAHLFQLPLSEVLSDARHGDHTHFEFVTTVITLENGQKGTGYTYTGGHGGKAILAMINSDLIPFIIGRDAEHVEALHDDTRWHIHYVGRGGLSAFSIAAIDIALWDIRGKYRNLSLSKMAGGRSQTCKAYCGGIDLIFPCQSCCQYRRLSGQRPQWSKDQGWQGRP